MIVGRRILQLFVGKQGLFFLRFVSVKRNDQFKQQRRKKEETEKKRKNRKNNNLQILNNPLNRCMFCLCNFLFVFNEPTPFLQLGNCRGNLKKKKKKKKSSKIKRRGGK